MADAIKKIDKEYQHTDDAVNCYGFRLLTAGYKLSEFKRNPIGYHMHERDKGVVVKWTDFRIDGDKVYAKPVINMAHPRAEQTVSEIENGFLNAASVGHIVALEWSEEPEMMLAGQTGPTITKWYNKETSLVDIPGNDGCLVLYDKDENEIKLADLSALSQSKIIKSEPSMSKLILSALAFSMLNLKPEATQEDADKALADLAGKVSGLEADKTKLTTEKAAVKKSLEDLQAETVTKEVTEMLATANKEGKATVAEVALLAEDYANNPAGLKKLLGARTAYTPVTEQLGANAVGALPEKYKGKTYDDLHTSGDLADLKANHKDAYVAVYKAKFNKEPQA